MELTIIGAGQMARGIAMRALAGRHRLTIVGKAFNTMFAGSLARGVFADQPLDVLIASDDEWAKLAVTKVALDGGLRALDAGPLARARELEALAYLQICLQERLGSGFVSTIKLLAEPAAGTRSVAPSWNIPARPGVRPHHRSVLKRAG